MAEDQIAGSAHHSYAGRGINSYRLRALREHGGDSILDVGCGSGAYVLNLADERRIEGVDAASFDAWSERPALFKVASATNLPHADASFDTVCSFETLEHLPDPDRALGEFFRVCRKNIIVSVPNCRITEGMRQSNLLYSHWGDPTHCNFYDMESIKDVVVRAGFEVDRACYINPINVGPFVLETLGLSGVALRAGSRLLKRFGGGKHHITILLVGRKP